MIRIEEQGFLALASYEAKLGLVEGLVLGAGMTVALAAAHAASRSLSEKAEDLETRKKIVSELRLTPGLLRDMLEMDRDLRELKAGFASYDDEGHYERELANRFDSLAVAMMATGMSTSDLHGLVNLGAGPSIHTHVQSGGDLNDLCVLQDVKQLDEGLSIGIFLRSRHSSTPISDLKALMALPSLEIRDVLDVTDALPSRTKERLSRAIFLHGQGIGTQEIDTFRRILNDDSFRLGPAGFEAIRTLSKKFPKSSLLDAVYHVEKEEDLIKLSKLNISKIPEYSYGIHPKIGNDGNIDWDRYEKDILEFETAPRPLLHQAKITKGDILSVWRMMKGNEKIASAVYALAAAEEIVANTSDPMASFRHKIAMVSKTEDADEHYFTKQIVEQTKTLTDAIKSGKLKKFNDTLKSQGISAWNYNDKLAEFLEHYDGIADWKSYGDLAEQLAKLAPSSTTSSGLGGKPLMSPEAKARLKAERRARDRLAKRDPEWAISEFPSEYKRGRRIAKFLEQIVDRIEELTKQGETVVVHGRDGELLYDLLMRRPDIDKSKIRYAITSRPITTWSADMPLTPEHGKELRRYWDYLARMVPTGAVHIDTGFEGSIPRWLDKKGFEVKSVQMVSANRPEEQIVVSMPITDQERRAIVLSDLEHSSQRIDQLEKFNPQTGAGGFGDMIYSLAAPGYHARAYGVYDELGLPRIPQKTPKTRLEEQRLRIATSDEPFNESVVEEEKLSAVK